MQAIFFISNDNPPFYPQIDQHYNWITIHGPLTYESFSELWHQYKPLAIYTYGDTPARNFLSPIFNVRKRWIHLHELPERLHVNGNVFSTTLGHIYDNEHPLVTVISSSFHSGDKILRPFRSLRAQSYKNWEWVIWDDSKDDTTYKRLLDLQKTELRMRVYKAPAHSGSIGELKRLAAGVAYGSYIVEVDHDDDLHADLLQWIVTAGKQYPEAQFFYTDCAEVYEGSLSSVSYGEFFAFGYSAHLNVWCPLLNTYVTSAFAPSPNGTTLRHIIGVPNHVRCWRTQFYDRIGKHNPLLSVSDDYDLLLRSYFGCEGKWCHIRACGYYQYRNSDGNFTFIRNSLIQHNCHHIYEKYMHALPPKTDNNNRPAWTYDGTEYTPTHAEYVPEPYTRSVVLLNPTTPEILAHVDADSHVYVIGPLPDNLPNDVKSRVSWWHLQSSDKYDDAVRYIYKFFHTGSEFVVGSTESPLYKS